MPETLIEGGSVMLPEYMHLLIGTVSLVSDVAHGHLVKFLFLSQDKVNSKIKLYPEEIISYV